MSRRVPGRTDHVVVVGAGYAGLSAALHLLGAGRRVTVLERADHPGGRAGRLDLTTDRGTYHVDPGPSVLTMPELLEEAFAAVGDRLADRLDLVRVDPAYRTHFADGSTIDVHTDAAAMADEIGRVCGAASVAGYRRLREWLTALYRVEIDRFIGANHDSPVGLLGPDLFRLAALGGFGRLGPKVAGFLPDERLRRIFSFQALYAGVSPAKALGAYGVIAYMDTIAGVYFPRGGMRRIGAALADAVVAAGGEIHYERTATGLVQQHGRVRAVRHRPTDDRRADAEECPADAVVLATELATAYDLAGGPPRRPARLRYAPSAVVLHLGLDRRLPDTAHHTISFGAAWDRTFAEIVDEGRLMSDPSLLITRPTVTDPGLAPDGGDQLFVLAPCPNTVVGPQDWSRRAGPYGDEVLATLAKRAHPGLDAISEVIDVARTVTPADWAADGMTAGTPFALAHTFPQTGPFRPANLVRRLPNVVLAGCGTTPGVGIPPVLISGRLAAQRITGAR